MRRTVTRADNRNLLRWQIKRITVPVLCAIGIFLSGCSSNQIDGYYYTASTESDGAGKYNVSRMYRQAEIGVISNGDEVIDAIQENADARGTIRLSDDREIDLTVTRVTPDGQSTEMIYGKGASSLSDYNDQLGIHLLIPEGLQESDAINYALTADTEFETVSITSVAEPWNDQTVTMSISLFPIECVIQSDGITVEQPVFKQIVSDQQLEADVILDEDQLLSYITVVYDNVLYEYRLSSANETDILAFLNDLK